MAIQKQGMGPYGIDHVNASGRRLRTFLETHALVEIWVDLILPGEMRRYKDYKSQYLSIMLG